MNYEKNLNSFLKLGYYLDYTNSKFKFDYSNIDKKKYVNYEKEELISIGSNLLLNAITSRYKGNQRNIVPISGGLDSRAVLSGLLMCTDAQKIETYTFGTPGTLDYEIGNYIAKKIGTRHTSFSLDQYNYSTEDLIDISKRVDNQTVLFHHPPIKIIKDIYGGSVFWSGFLGETVAGAHLPSVEINNLTEAIKYFIKKNTFVKSIDLRSPENKNFETMILYSANYNKNINPVERIDFDNRQAKYIAPHVLMKGFEYVTPLADKDWFDFMLSLDNTYRYNQNLYKRILSETFPFEFSLKTKTNFGLPLSASKFEIFIKRAHSKMNRILIGKNVNINYLDFNNEIRENKVFNKTIYENLSDLENRKIVNWVDLNKIWQDHMNKNADYADAILVLCSLEIQMKAKE